MPRPARYSPSRRAAGLCAAAPAASAPQENRAAAPATRRPRHVLTPRQWVLAALLAGVFAGLLASNLWLLLRPPPPRITQRDIDAAVLNTLQTQPLPSAVANAAEAVAAAVVRVVGLAADEGGAEREHGVGSGVVIVDSGVILTNLHVVLGADSVRVTFADGMQSAARITGMQPEDDLAVLQAASIPDDLQAAPLRSTQGLRAGDAVVAVGFPFGIGPSVSAGVISGFQRAFHSPEGKRELHNLIQFDAAANPGNSGGPLLTLDGEVVGIVTAILNPGEARTFAGIGFAVPIENAAAAAGSSPF